MCFHPEWLASYSGSVGGACINNYSLFFKLFYVHIDNFSSLQTNLDSLAQLIDYKPPARLKLKRKDNSPASNNLLEWEKSRELPLEVPCNSPLDDRSLFG